jgi:hypothetical protein
MTVVDSVAAVRLDEESGRLAGDHRVPIYDSSPGGSYETVAIILMMGGSIL